MTVGQKSESILGYLLSKKKRLKEEKMTVPIKSDAVVQTRHPALGNEQGISCSKSPVKSKKQGHGDTQCGKALVIQAWQPEFSLQMPHGARRADF